MSRAALDRYQREMDYAKDNDDEHVIACLEQLWDEAADKLNAEYEGDLNALSPQEYTEAIAEQINWRPR